MYNEPGHGYNILAKSNLHGYNTGAAMSVSHYSRRSSGGGEYNIMYSMRRSYR